MTLWKLSCFEQKGILYISVLSAGQSNYQKKKKASILSNENIYVRCFLKHYFLSTAAGRRVSAEGFSMVKKVQTQALYTWLQGLCTCCVVPLMFASCFRTSSHFSMYFLHGKRPTANCKILTLDICCLFRHLHLRCSVCHKNMWTSRGFTS